MGKREKKDELPDLTVADMDVEGMPWNSKHSWRFATSRRGSTSDNKKSHQIEERDVQTIRQEEDPLTREETRGLVFMALKAGLLVAAVFAGAALIFVLFCQFVWLR